jgi:DNA replication protein DnaC
MRKLREIVRLHLEMALGPRAIARSLSLSPSTVAAPQEREAEAAGVRGGHIDYSRLFDELAQARADGTYPHLLSRLAKAQVLILDDFGLEPLAATQHKEMLEVLDDRYQLGSTIVASQLEPQDWHAVIGDATLADAICDRLVHNAHRLKLGGESIRKAESSTSGKKAAK